MKMQLMSDKKFLLYCEKHTLKGTSQDDQADQLNCTKGALASRKARLKFPDWFFKKHGIRSQNAARNARIPLREATHPMTCSNCGKEYKSKNRKNGVNNFCSRKCANTFHNSMKPSNGYKTGIASINWDDFSKKIASKQLGELR